MTIDLNKWSAEVVMGFTKTYLPFDKENYWFEKDGEIVYYKSEWHPLTDLNQAFMVVEKMRKKGWIFNLEIDKNTCVASFGNGTTFAKSKDPATAILKAAYAVLETK